MDKVTIWASPLFLRFADSGSIKSLYINVQPMSIVVSNTGNAGTVSRL